MSGDQIEITVTCPRVQAEYVARQIALTHKLSTRFSDGSREFVACGTTSGVHSMESICDTSVITSVVEDRTLNVQGDIRTYQDDSLHADPRPGVDELKSVNDPGAASGGNKGLSEHLRMMSGYAETLARVMHHVSEFTNSWVDLASLHASPSLSAHSGVVAASSVGDGSASGDELRAHTSDADHPDGGGA